MRVTELVGSAAGLPEHEVWRLLTVATGRSRAQLVVDPVVSKAEAERFDDLARKRLDGVPLQYLEGSVDFGPVRLVADRRALVPRPETEQLWDLVVHRLASRPPAVVVDLCTGSGNLALALKHSFPNARILATELSADAADLARRNVEATALDVEVLEGDLFAPLPAEVRGQVDVVVANPPYLAASEVEALPFDVREHEPRQALVAGTRGDEVLARIAAGAAGWLRPGGLLAVEISEFLGARCLDLFGSFDPELVQDLTGRDRFIVGHQPPSAE